jgi:predicted dehydrogenase
MLLDSPPACSPAGGVKDAVCLVGTRWGHYLGVELRRFYKGPLAVCGRNEARTHKLAKKLNADLAIRGWERAVEERDVRSVILALPPELHAPAAIAAAACHKHVFVEKPIALNLEQADAMIAAARCGGVVLFVGENVPYRSEIREIRRLLPRIGEPRTILVSSLNIRTEPARGILLEQGIHYVRAVRCLFGEPSSIVAIHSTCVGPEDNVTFILESGGGWHATVCLSRQASAGLVPEFVVTGSLGALNVSPDRRTVDLYPLQPTKRTRLVSQIRPWWLQEALRSPESQRSRFPLPRPDRMGYRAELMDFLGRATIGGNPDVSSAVEARRDLEIVQAGYASMRTGEAEAVREE